MSIIINYNRWHFKDLCKLYCKAHNLTLKIDYGELLSGIISDYKGNRIKLLSINGKIKGYVFFSKPCDSFYSDRTIIDEIFIHKDYSTQANYCSLLESARENSIFRHTKFAQILLDNNITRSHDIISLLDLSLEKKLFEMKIPVCSSRRFETRKDINFSAFRKNVDEGKRSEIQNSIFRNSKSHRDCSIDDIMYEEGQDFFMDDGCLFLEYNGETAGYSQVVLEKYPKEHPYIVNFGIIEKYRGLGLSKVLLEYTLNFIRQKGYKEAYINVDADNYRAYSLYKKLGFDRINTYCTYLYSYSC